MSHPRKRTLEALEPIIHLSCGLAKSIPMGGNNEFMQVILRPFYGLTPDQLVQIVALPYFAAIKANDDQLILFFNYRQKVNKTLCSKLP